MPRRRGIGLDFLDALPSDGERRLMLATLIDAVRLTRSLQAEEARTGNLSVLKRRMLLRERRWFQSSERDRPFAFQTICEALGLDADYVRRCVFRPAEASSVMPVRRYAARAEESWLRQRKHGGQIVLLKRRRRRSAKPKWDTSSKPQPDLQLKAAH